MHWVERDGVRLPRRIGGHPALDFCNTWAGWGEPPDPRREWLRSYDVLVAWAAYAELLSDGDRLRLSAMAGRRPDEAEHVLGEARRLRTLLHSAVLDPSDVRALAGVTGFVRAAAAAARLRPSDSGAVARVVPRQVGLSLPVRAVALCAEALLTSPDLRRVAACPGHDCGWLFLDRSGRRRWCSMADCGNRAKVAAHARRAKQEQRGP